ncbi:F-box/kelch-repeat protein At3g61590 [Triticum aestivum]|nr:F-box/kelch-repeat protein At3g61590-like [Triticum aestivum]
MHYDSSGVVLGFGLEEISGSSFGLDAAAPVVLGFNFIRQSSLAASFPPSVDAQDCAAAAAFPMSAMTATLHHRPRSRSPLEDEDLLSEILLRLPPQPSSLPRASAVCKRWRRLVSDSGFLRRYRQHHRRSPPVLGFFRSDYPGISYTPAMEAPDRVPASRFSLHLNDRYIILSCRHGLVLISHSSRNQVLVWDPVTGDQHRVAAPLGIDMTTTPMDGQVLRAAADAQHFQVVLVNYKKKYARAIAAIYSSETGVWSNLIQTPVPREAMEYESMPPVLVGDSLYILLPGDSTSVILEVDLDSQSLAVSGLPMDTFAKDQFLMVMRAEGGGLGVLSLTGFAAELWKRNTNCDGVASWVLGRTFELDKLLPLNSENIRHTAMVAYAEENNVAFLRTFDSIFMVQLESLQFSKLPENSNCDICYPLESVYAAETSIGGGHDGADQNMLNQ